MSEDGSLPRQRIYQDRRCGCSSKQEHRSGYGGPSTIRIVDTHTYPESLSFPIRSAPSSLRWSNLTPYIIPPPRVHHRTGRSRSHHTRRQEHEPGRCHKKKRKSMKKHRKQEQFGLLGWLLRKLCICS